MKTLLLAVLYPEVEKYFHEFSSSINKQDYKEFDVLIIDDHAAFNYESISRIKDVVRIENNLAPASIRELGIQYARKNNYEYLIFADTDDNFSGNRVRLSVEYLNNTDFVFNEIDIIDGDGQTIESNFLRNLEVHPEYSNVSQIYSKNLFGLSHTAVNVDCLSDINIPQDVLAVDWWIYSILLINQYRGVFLEDAKTYYRQTNDNIVGRPRTLTVERLHKGIDVKKKHYHYLKEYCESQNYDTLSRTYEEYMKKIVNLRAKLKNKSFQSNYIQTINNNFASIYNGWWSEIITIDEWRKYAS
ncbi:MAG TPA: glycosyltransferase [Bacteroidales bacterium]|nr:glycosyltransferase [Bacteroidales bacterium]